MPYKRKRKNRVEWVAEVMRQGQRFYKVFKTKREALMWETEIRNAPVADLTTPTASLTLIEWANQYLEFSRAKFVMKTFQEKRIAFKRFFLSVKPELPVERLTPGQVLKHLQGQAQERSGHAANKDRKNLVAAWNWGVRYLGLPQANPCLVETFPEVRKARYIPPEKDFWKVYETAAGQDKVMLLAYLHLAARRSELFQLVWDDIDFINSRVRLGTRKRKGGTLEFDWLPMTEELREALLVHREGANSEIVFPDPEAGGHFSQRRHYMKNLCRRAGVKHFGFHAIRHLTASLLAQASIPMITIQGILRHKNLATTERYVRGLEPLRPALEILSKRNSRPEVPTSVRLADTKKEQVA